MNKKFLILIYNIYANVSVHFTYQTFLQQYIFPSIQVVVWTISEQTVFKFLSS